MVQAFAVVHVFVSGETAENGLPQRFDKSMPAVLAGPSIAHLPANSGLLQTHQVVLVNVDGPQSHCALDRGFSIFIFETPMHSERLHQSGLPETVLSTSTSAATCSGWTDLLHGHLQLIL
jgi:hypothetical protein